MGRLSRATMVVGLALVVTSAVALPAAATTTAGRRVAPKQFFTGVINGTDGNTANPIAINMACFGPLKPGETGHPMGGQTVAVHQLFPPSTAPGSLGQTGNDRQINLYFNAVPASSASGTVTFTRYDKTQKLPTSLTLPCSGTGTAYFTPIPAVPPSRSATVPVEFVGQP
jgi:hypothetical protein